MKDRIPALPGRTKMTLPDGAVQYVTLERADEPIVVGTLLNKATLLSDDTAAALHLPQENPTVNNALNHLSGGVVQVGDMKTTAREDLDENWLLCDGSKLSKEDYPELYEMLAEKLSSTFFKSQDLWSERYTYGDTINCITYANGYWVVGGKHTMKGESEATYCARIAYATNLNGPWTTKDLWTSTNASDQRINDIAYANGYWVAVGVYSNKLSTDSFPSYPKIAYSTSLSDDWVVGEFISGRGTGNRVVYANGYWVIGGEYDSGSNSYTRISYTTNLASNSWTSQNLSYGFLFRDMTFANGYWAVSSSGSQIAYSTDLTNWKYNSIGSGALRCITYADGKWIVGGEVSKSSSYPKQNAILYYTTTLDGDWKFKVIDEGCVNCLAYWNGLFVVGVTKDMGISSSSIYYGKGLESEWAVKELWSGRSNYSAVNDLICVNRELVIVGSRGMPTASSGGQDHSFACIAYPDGVALPTAKGDLNTYIRAKGTTS